MPPTTRSRQPVANQNSPENSPEPTAYLEVLPQSGGRKRKYDVVPSSPHDGFLTLRLPRGQYTDRANNSQSANLRVTVSPASPAEPFISLKKSSVKKQEFTKDTKVSGAALGVEVQAPDLKDSRQIKVANSITHQSEQLRPPLIVSKDQEQQQAHLQRPSLDEKGQEDSATQEVHKGSEDNLGPLESLIRALNLLGRPSEADPSFSPIAPGFSPVSLDTSPATPSEVGSHDSTRVVSKEPQAKPESQEQFTEVGGQTLFNSQTIYSEVAVEVATPHATKPNQIEAEVGVEQIKQTGDTTSAFEHSKLVPVPQQLPIFEPLGSEVKSPPRGKSSTPKSKTKRKASVSPQPNSPPKRQTRQSVREQTKTSEVANCFITLRVRRGFDPAAMAPGTTSATNSLKDIIQNLYDIQSQTYGFRPETQPVLVGKIEELTQSLAKLQDLADPTINPNSNLQDLYLAPEIIDYVDDGRNPDIYGRDFIEAVQRGNAVVNGKKQAFKDFSVIYAQKLKEGIGGVGKQVDMVMEHAGMEEELRKAEAEKEQQKTENGTDSKDGDK